MTTSTDKTNKIKMIQLDDPITVYCPVLKATLSLVSDEVDELGRFSQFIIWSAGHGYDFTMVETVTQLKAFVIWDEIHYLQKIGLMTERDDGVLQLTELGEEYFRKIHAIDAFNDADHQVLINCVSGELIPYVDALYTLDTLPEGSVSLYGKIVKELYQNLDPANAQEFLFDHYEFQLTEEEKEALHVSVNYENKTSFIKQRIDYVPAFPYETPVLPERATVVERLDDEDYAEIRSDLSLLYPFSPFRLQVSNPILDPYRHTLDTMRKLEQFDDTLLSEKAKELLSLKSQEQALQDKMSRLYLDQISGAIIRYLPQVAVDDRRQRNTDVSITPQFEMEDFTEVEWLEVIARLSGVELEIDEWEISWKLDENQYVQQWVDGNDIF